MEYRGSDGLVIRSKGNRRPDDWLGNIFRSRVSAAGESAFRVSAVQPSAAGSCHQLLMAEKPEPEFPMPVAVTRHLKLFLPGVGLTTLGQPRLSEGAQPYLNPALKGKS